MIEDDIETAIELLRQARTLDKQIIRDHKTMENWRERTDELLRAYPEYNPKG